MNEEERKPIMVSKNKIEHMTFEEVWYKFEKLALMKIKRFYEINCYDELEHLTMTCMYQAFKYHNVENGYNFITLYNKILKYEIARFYKKYKQKSCEISIYMPLGTDEDSKQIIDNIADDNTYIEDIIDEIDITKSLEVFVNSLTEQERKILYLMLHKKTQQEIGDMNGCSRKVISRMITKIKNKYLEVMNIKNEVF